MPNQPQPGDIWERDGERRNHKLRRQKRRAMRAIRRSGIGMLAWYSDELGPEFYEEPNQ